MNPLPPIDRLLASVKWSPLPPSPWPKTAGLYATHEGTVHFGDVALRCYTLNDGRRILDAEDVERMFGGEST